MSEDEQARPPATGVALHLTTENVWETYGASERYYPERFDDEGFVHLTHGEVNVIAVGNRYYRADPRPYLALEVDLSRVRAPAIYEDDARLYPHVYGPIDRGAVLRVWRIERASDGTFLGIGAPV